MSADGKAVKEGYQWEAKTQWKRPVLTSLLSVSVALYFSRNAKHDIDNYNKLLLDALTGLVWEDDSLIMELVIRKGLDKANPRIEVEIQELS